MPNNKPTVDTDRIMHYRKLVVAYQTTRERETDKNGEIKVFLNTL
jgi:hypothetical protein